MNRLTTVLALCLLCTAGAMAQVPRTISFQGVLADAQGVLLPDNTYTLTLSIYDQATGGSAIFSESQQVQVLRGVFNAIIGSTSPSGIPAGLDFNSQYWLGVQVNNGTELAPRTPFTSVPYALNAATAQVAVRAINADTAAWALSAGSAMLADTAVSVRGGHVTSVNGQQGSIEILGAGSTTITRSGNQFVIRSTDTSGGGIRRIDNFDGSLVVDPPQGPFVTLFIREGGVQTYHLRDLVVTTEKIADQAVTNAKLAPNSVTTDKIMDGQVMTADIADLNVTNAKLGPNSVTTDKIMDGQVMTADIADLNVTNAKLGPNSVTTDKIMDGQVMTADIGLNQVIASRIGTEGATSGYALMSNGTATPVWADPILMNIPYSATVNSADTLWSMNNTGSGPAGGFNVKNPASTASALIASTDGQGMAIHAEHTSTTGTMAAVHAVTNSTSSSAETITGVVTSTSPGGFSSGVRGINNGTGGLGIGVWGSQNGSGWGVYGQTPNGIGVFGNSSTGFGVYGSSSSGTGVYGSSTSGVAGRFENTNTANTSSTLVAVTNSNGDALTATNSGTGKAANFLITSAANGSPAIETATYGGGAGIQASNFGTGTAGYFRKPSTTSGNPAIYATSSDFGGTIRGDANGTSGTAGFFWATNAAGTGSGLEAVSQGLGSAAVFQSNNVASTARTVAIFNAGTGQSLYARRGAGTGLALSSTAAIHGDNADGVGVAGVATNGVGVYGTSTNNHGVWGVAPSMAGLAGVLGRNDAVSGYGVWGQSFGGGIGVYGTSQSGPAARFEITNAANASATITAQTAGAGAGVLSTTTTGVSVEGYASTNDLRGRLGGPTASYGYQAAVSGHNGGTGFAFGSFVTSSTDYTAFFRNMTSPSEVWIGVNDGGYNTALLVEAPTQNGGSSNSAAQFFGDVIIAGNLNVTGTVAKGGGTFKIDHPLDPTNKYLYHSFVESPEMMNIYTGTVRLDENGEAIVTMPGYFESLNGDFRYQLTSIGAPAPNLFVAQEIENNRFKIAGGAPGAKVSWTVTGVRHDAYARHNPVVVEVEKPAAERGTYLHPEAFGVTASSRSPRSLPSVTLEPSRADAPTSVTMPTTESPAPSNGIERTSAPSNDQLTMPKLPEIPASSTATEHGASDAALKARDAQGIRGDSK